ncbi:MAG: hypothetical protein HKL80_10935, partial [Acidimicrobiales bacterium]|nr:hypothetical protein [Acidimicrobiales bacterium]
MRTENSLSGGGRRRQRAAAPVVETVDGWPPFANALLATNALPKDKIQQLLTASESSGTSLLKAVQSSGSISEEAIAKSLAMGAGIEYVDLDRYTFNAAAASLVPVRLVKQNGILPIGWKFGTPVIAVSDPENLMLQDELKSILGRDFQPMVAKPSKIAEYASRLYGEEMTVPGGNMPEGVPTASDDDVGDSIFATMFATDGGSESPPPPPPPPRVP